MRRILLREALSSRCRALQPEVFGGLLAAGIPVDTTPLLGIADVTVNNVIYEPVKDGSAAIILPTFKCTDDRSELYDLIAIGLHSHRSATRCGMVQILGDEWIDAAFIHERPVPVYLDGIRWLASGCRGVFIIDLAVAPLVLSEALGVACSDEVTARRVHDAMALPPRVPPIFIPEVLHVSA